MITTKDIIIDPHATLRARAEEVKKSDFRRRQSCFTWIIRICNCFSRWWESRKIRTKTRIGLAAPQINVSKRMIAVHIPDEEFPEDTVSYALYNPK